MEKIKVSRERVITDLISVSIDYAIENLNKLKDEYAGKGACIDIEGHWEYGDTWPRAVVRWMEEETDAEYTKRIARERNYRRTKIQTTIKTLESEGIPVPSKLQKEYDALSDN